MPAEPLMSFDHLPSLVGELSSFVPALNPIVTDLLVQKGIQWQMARFDQIDQCISGNKAYKLLPNILEAKRLGCQRILSFGGMYSNHLHAMATLCKQLNIECIAVVRAYAEQAPSPTLRDLQQNGCLIHFASRAEYQKRYDHDYWQLLRQQYGDVYIIPEGGANSFGVDGASLMLSVLANSLDQQAQQPNLIAMATGTGTSFAGFINNPLLQNSRYLAITALDNAAQIESTVKSYCSDSVKLWDIVSDYHCGGFAKTNDDLLAFMQEFQQQQQIPLEPVYTAKLCYAVNDLIHRGVIDEGSNIVTIHTGGLQGLRGMQQKIQRFQSRAALECDSGVEVFDECA